MKNGNICVTDAEMEWADAKEKILKTVADVLATVGRLDCAVDRRLWKTAEAEKIHLMARNNAMACLNPDIDRAFNALHDQDIAELRKARGKRENETDSRE